MLPLALLLFYTGVRDREAKQIDWRQVDLDETGNVFRRYNVVTTDDVVRAMKGVEGFGNGPTLGRLSSSVKTEET